MGSLCYPSSDWILPNWVRETDNYSRRLVVSEKCKKHLRSKSTPTFSNSQETEPMTRQPCTKVKTWDIILLKADDDTETWRPTHSAPVIHFLTFNGPVARPK